jgi:hypothetical protein
MKTGALYVIAEKGTRGIAWELVVYFRRGVGKQLGK